MKRLPEPTRFIARPAAIETGYQGASMKDLDANDMAEEILGPLDWGKATGYMIRRFGPFNKPCDPDKEIAAWAITTPMKGLHLTFRSAPTAGRFLFGWIAQDAMYKDLRRCSFEREDAWRTGLEAWCQRTRGVDWPPMSEFEEWNALYKADCPLQPKDDLLSHADRALRRAVADLLRTVSVQDTDLSILGEAETRLGHVKEHPNGGDYLPPIAWDRRMWKVYGAIHRMGGGLKGLNALIAAAGIED